MPVSLGGFAASCLEMMDERGRRVKPLASICAGDNAAAKPPSVPLLDWTDTFSSLHLSCAPRVVRRRTPTAWNRRHHAHPPREAAKFATVGLVLVLSAGLVHNSQWKNDRLSRFFMDDGSHLGQMLM